MSYATRPLLRLFVTSFAEGPLSYALSVEHNRGITVSSFDVGYITLLLMSAYVTSCGHVTHWKREPPPRT